MDIQRILHTLGVLCTHHPQVANTFLTAFWFFLACITDAANNFIYSIVDYGFGAPVTA